MRQFVWTKLSDAEKKEALARPESSVSAELTQKVQAILAGVKQDGDAALLRFTAQFDGITLESLEVTPQEKNEARSLVSAEAKAAIERAASQITAFHEAQLPKDLRLEVAPGIVCERSYRAIDAVGLYVPGGVTPLPSTVLMLGIPARLAGCPEVVLCTPPSKDGKINPHLLFAAELVGVKRIFKVGGAQAIAAMAYGTGTVPKVNKICGPGNAWVTEAKLQVAQDPKGAAIDMPAGPSEVMVIADDSANTEFIAWDLLSQAEHGPDSQVVLVSDSTNILSQTLKEIAKAMATLPRRDIAAKALAHARFILAQDMTDAFEISNEYAPEHLIIQVESPNKYRASIRNAGSVFLGPWSPESVGDYASGTNHVLPTYGYAKAFSGLSVDTFLKAVTFQELTRAGLEDIGPTVETLAELEALDAHRQAVSVRLRKMP